MNPPFIPVSFAPGPPTKIAWEDGPGAYVNPPNSATPVIYNGQNQTSRINVAKPMPPWELGPGPADPLLSAAKSDYTGSGYGKVGAGTIGVGEIATATPAGPPAQPRMFVQGGQLYILDNVTGTAYAVGPAIQVPQPPLYSPT